MRRGKRFVIGTKGSTGGIEFHPMWQWIRLHPERQPQDVESLNSRRLRDALVKQGWTQYETEDEVRLLPPELAGDTATAAVVGAPSEDDAIEDGGIDAEEQFEFALESHLRDFIVRNLADIRVGGRHVRLFTDSSNREGVEYPTQVGPIDVLAIDESGNFFVFELKLARGPDTAMGQLARYMGWVKKHLAEGREVHGVLVAKEIDEKLRYGALVVPNVSLLEYEISFKWRDASLNV